MKAIVTTSGQAISNRAFTDFIEWIDRSEKTTKTYLNNLRQFAVWLKYSGVEEPTRADVISYRNWLLSEHEAIKMDPESCTGWSYRTDANGKPVMMTCKPATAAQYLRSVIQFFKWTSSEGLYANIAENIKTPKLRNDMHKKDAFTASEVQEVEESIKAKSAEREQTAREADKDRSGRIQRTAEQSKRLYAIYLLAVNAGLRTVEISRANVKDLETKSGQTWLYICGKGHTEADQRKPLAPEVAKAIKDYLKIRADKPTSASPLFVSTGNRSGGKRIASTTISTMLKQAMREAGYNSERLTAHSLRHTAGTAVQEITRDIYATQKYMRHSNPATTEIYLHNETEKTEAVIAQRLYNFYHGQL